MFGWGYVRQGVCEGVLPLSGKSRTDSKEVRNIAQGSEPEEGKHQDLTLVRKILAPVVRRSRPNSSFA